MRVISTSADVFPGWQTLDVTVYQVNSPLGPLGFSAKFRLDAARRSQALSRDPRPDPKWATPPLHTGHVIAFPCFGRLLRRNAVPGTRETVRSRIALYNSIEVSWPERRINEEQPWSV